MYVYPYYYPQPLYGRCPSCGRCPHCGSYANQLPWAQNTVGNLQGGTGGLGSSLGANSLNPVVGNTMSGCQMQQNSSPR